MKKIIALILALAMLTLPCLSVSAVEEDLSKAVSEFEGLVQRESWSINPQVQGLRWSPFYSEETNNRYYTLSNEIYNYDFQTFDDLYAEQAKFDEYLRTKCVSIYELEDIMTMFSFENNYDKYYDEIIWNEFIAVYDEAKNAYESKDEEAIHIAYVKCRNMMNKLCLYNTTYGDVNHDGVFTIEDVTYIQKVVAGINPNLNISQLFVAEGYIQCSVAEPITKNLNPTITSATDMQKYLVNTSESTDSFNKSVSKLIDVGGENQFELYPDDRTIGAVDFMANKAFYNSLKQLYIYQTHPGIKA